MTSRYVFILFTVLVSTDLHAQVNDRTPDSLVAFRQAMQFEAVMDNAPAPPEEYMLVWKEEREGGRYIVQRADGRTLKDLLTAEGRPCPDAVDLLHACALIYYGQRHAMITVNPNTGLIRYTYLYFERRTHVVTTALTAQEQGVPSIDLFQDHPPDSLVAFREAMPLDSLMGAAPGPPEEYMLMWKEQRVLQNYSVQRADGSSLQDLLTTAGDLRPDVHDPFKPGALEYYGHRYAKVWVRSDTGLPIYTNWYFERR